MTLLVLPFSYLSWHYSRAWVGLWAIQRNLIWFIYHFFSLDVLSRTLFAPWRRLGEVYPERFSLSVYLSAFFINSLMRLIGLVARLSVIIFGYLVLFLTCLLGVFSFLVWLFLPFLLLIGFVLAIRLIILR